ncbi:MAG TPA: hypothetical protein PKK99_11760 [Bacteroidia bacterium]|nr:hypothetical protein [Bacteroidia bacterium]
MKIPKLTPVGFISKVHGYKGQVILALEHCAPSAIQKAAFLFIEMDGLPVPFPVQEFTEKGDDILLKLELIDSDTEAKKIVRQTVFAEKLHIREDVELDWPDLVGFIATDQSFGLLGMIEEVEELPMQWIAHCHVNGKELLFPLNEQVLVEINEEKKELLLNLPEGLIQVYLEM